jgi:hypothetical protein
MAVITIQKPLQSISPLDIQTHSEHPVKPVYGPQLGAFCALAHLLHALHQALPNKAVLHLLSTEMADPIQTASFHRRQSI